jgi:integration host factor subunit alpha
MAMDLSLVCFMTAAIYEDRLPCLVFCDINLCKFKAIQKIEGGESMTKADLIEKVYLKTGNSKKETGDTVEKVFELIKSTLENGEKIKIAGFGNFVVQSKATRCGRNPQTGDAIEISSRKILTFEPSQILKGAINGNRA